MTKGIPALGGTVLPEPTGDYEPDVQIPSPLGFSKEQIPIKAYLGAKKSASIRIRVDPRKILDLNR